MSGHFINKKIVKLWWDGWDEKKHPGSLFYMSEQKSVEKISMLSDAFFKKNFGANLKSQIPHSAVSLIKLYKFKM